MSDCVDCKDRNPSTPVYSQAIPQPADDCDECNDPKVIIVPGGGSGGAGKVINLLSGSANILIDTVRGITDDDFTITDVPYIAPTISLSLSPSGIQAYGFQVNDVTLSWSYNKAVVSQKVFRGAVEIFPTIVPGPNNSFSAVLTGENLVDNQSYKVEGDDGTNIVSSTKSITFGHFLIWVEGQVYSETSPDNDVITLIETGTQEGPYSGRKTGNNFLLPVSQSSAEYFYIAIQEDVDDLGVTDDQKFYEHDGQDAGGGMFLLKTALAINTGLTTTNYNIYRGLFGAQGGAQFEVL